MVWVALLSRLPRVTEAVILGGGIAGTAMALALHQAGFAARIHEAYPRDTVAFGGALTTVWSNGMHALAQLGALSAVEEASLPLRTFRAFDVAGNQQVELSTAQPYPPLPGFRHMLRGQLNRALHDLALARGIPITHERRLETVTREAGKPRLWFADGSSTDAELLIGADGAHSLVRRFVDEHAPGSDYTGERIVYGTSTEPSEPDLLRMYLGSRTTFGHVGNPRGGTWWFCRVRDREGERAELTEHVAEYVLDALQEQATDLGRFVRTSTELAANNTWQTYDLPKWHDSADTVLIGDAAHATSPASAQGAAMAIEDAVILAKALRDLGERQRVFAVYERMRRARVNRIVYGGAVQASGESGPANADRNDRQRWLYEYPLDWDIPVTESLAEQVEASQQ